MKGISGCQCILSPFLMRFERKSDAVKLLKLVVCQISIFFGREYQVARFGCPTFFVREKEPKEGHTLKLG